MPQPIPPTFTTGFHCHHIETQIDGAELPLMQKVPSDQSQACQLALSDRFFRTTVLDTGTGLDLDEHNQRTASHHQIDFAARFAIALGQAAKAAVLEKTAGKLLRPASQTVLGILRHHDLQQREEKNERAVESARDACAAADHAAYSRST